MIIAEANGERLPIKNDKIFASKDLLITPEKIFRKYFHGTNEQYNNFLQKYDLDVSETYLHKSNIETLPQYTKKFIESAYDKDFIQLFDVKLNQIEKGSLTRHSNQFENLTIKFNGMSDEIFDVFAKEYISTFEETSPALVAYCYMDSENKTINFLVSTLVIYEDMSDENKLYTSYESRNKTDIRLSNSITYPSAKAKEIYQNYVNTDDKNLLFTNLENFGVDVNKINELQNTHLNNNKFLNEVKKLLNIKLDIKKSSNMNLTSIMQHMYKTSHRVLSEEDDNIVVRSTNGQWLTESDYFFNTPKKDKEKQALLDLTGANKAQQKENLNKRSSMSPNTSADYIDENSTIDNDSREETKQVMQEVKNELEKIDNTSIEESDTEKIINDTSKKSYDEFVLMQNTQAQTADELAYKSLEKFKANILVSGNLIDNYNKIRGELTKSNIFAVDRFDFLLKNELKNISLKEKVVAEYKNILLVKNDTIKKLKDEILKQNDNYAVVLKSFESEKQSLLKSLEKKDQEIIDVEIVFDKIKEETEAEIDKLKNNLEISNINIIQQSKVIEHSKIELQRIPILENNVDDLEKSLDAKDELNDDLEKSLDAKKTKIDELVNENEFLAVEINKKQQSLNKLQSSHDVLNNKFSTLTLEKGELETSVKKSQQEIEELKQKESELKEETILLKKSNHLLKTENELLNASSKELEKEVQRITGILENIQIDNKKLDDEITHLKKLTKLTSEASKSNKKNQTKQQVKEKIIKNVEYSTPIDRDELQNVYNEEYSLNKQSINVARLYILKVGKLDASKLPKSEHGDSIKNELNEFVKIGLLKKSSDNTYVVNEEYENLMFKNYKTPIQDLKAEKSYYDYLIDLKPDNENKSHSDTFTREGSKVKSNERLDKKDYFEKLKIAQNNNGYYNKNSRAFEFKNESDAQLFLEESQKENQSSIKRNRR